MVNLIALSAANAQRWQQATLTRNFSSVARRLVEVGAKARYLKVEALTGVPWFVVAVIHEREASQNWNAQLGQGDPLDRISVHVPAGRGPFKTWESGAFDALANCTPHAAHWKDWSAGGALTLLEQYNGLGYFYRGKPSPYVWSGTDQYVSGKYVRDGVYDPNVVDAQLGCAGIIKAMMDLDHTITFAGVKITAGDTRPKPTDLHEPDNKPNIGKEDPPPSFATAIAALINFIASIFRRKQ